MSQEEVSRDKRILSCSQTRENKGLYLAEPLDPSWEGPGELALPPDLPWEQPLNLAQGGARPLLSGSTPLGTSLPSLWGLLGQYLGWLSPQHSQECASVILSSLPDPSPAQNWIKNKNMSCVCFNQLQDMGAFQGKESRPELAPGQAG